MIEKSGSDVREIPQSELRAQHTAVLIIHGIGEQHPYETIDQFARNLSRYLRHEGGIDDLKIIPDRVDHNTWVEARVRLQTDRHGPRNGEGLIDLYEYYWAPETENKVSYTQALWWLIRTTLSPIRRLDENVKVLQDESGQRITKNTILGRELLRICLLYTPFLFIFVCLLFLLPDRTTLSGLLSSALKLNKPSHPIAAGFAILFFAISIVLTCVVVRQLFQRWLRYKRGWSAMMSSWWLLLTMSIAGLSAMAGSAIANATRLPWGRYVALLWNRKILLAVAILASGKLLQIILRDFVGDLVVYLNTNHKAKNYEARVSILQGATQALTRLLKGIVQEELGKKYDQVIIVGHSLGSVIAYDVLNSLINEYHGAPDQIEGKARSTDIKSEDLEKIKGLVTLGSPLDKVYYFFRENIREEQTIRAQINSFLHSFRKVSSGRKYGECEFVRYVPNQLSDDFKWFNAWSNQDPISGALHFYVVTERRKFKYRLWIYAHLSYWEDPRFYSFFGEPLLLGHPVKKEMAAAKKAAV
jgi:hypothetical protein